MQNIRERIDHVIDIFRQTGRHDVMIGLTHADWDVLCAILIDMADLDHEDPRLTRNSYQGVPIITLHDSDKSFVGHDLSSGHERRFPLEALQPMDLEPA